MTPASSVSATPERAADPAPGTRSERTIQLACVWSGAVCTVLAVLGLVVISGFIPTTDPSASGREITDFYSDNVTGIRVGMVFAMAGFSLFVPFGIAIAMQTRRIEDRPTLTYIQIACVAIAALEGVLSAVIWATAAYRPDQIDPDITRAIHDLGWFMFLFDVPPFMLWIGAIGIAILRDHRSAPVFPRWFGYFNLWVAFLIFPADLMAFFKTGPFSYEGALALYLPFSMFFAWILVMIPMLMRAINHDTELSAIRAG